MLMNLHRLIKLKEALRTEFQSIDEKMLERA